jgi:hypothetical protein
MSGYKTDKKIKNKKMAKKKKKAGVENKKNKDAEKLILNPQPKKKK